MAESATRAPRVISSLAVLALALPATLLVGVPFSLLAYGLATDFSGDLAEMGGLDWIADLTPLEFVHTLVLPGQLLLLGLALFVGLLSREPLRRRLGLVRPATPWAWVALFAVGSLVPGVLGQYLAAGLFGEPSDHLQQLGQMILTPRGLSAVYVGLCLSLLPGTCEELLFRGLVQQRLQRRWRAPLAIGLPALCFALLHMDPMHVVAVLPVGLWFGLVAWGTRSVLPAIACHAVALIEEEA